MLIDEGLTKERNYSSIRLKFGFDRFASRVHSSKEGLDFRVDFYSVLNKSTL